MKRLVIIQCKHADGSWVDHGTVMPRGVATAIMVDAGEDVRAIDADTREPVDLFVAA
jgi:hypothetical protein